MLAFQQGFRCPILLEPWTGSSPRRGGRLGPLAFVLAVTFATVTSITGYRTNLVFYGPGGSQFTDSFRVGAPVPSILVVVTTAGIVFCRGL